MEKKYFNMYFTYQNLHLLANTQIVSKATSALSFYKLNELNNKMYQFNNKTMIMN